MTGEQGPDRGFEGFGDLFEAQAPDVTEMENLLIRLRKPLKALEKLAIWKEPPVLGRKIPGPSRHLHKRRGIRRHCLPTPTTHLISKSIHGDPKQPCFESTAFLVLGKLLDDGAEG